VNSGSAVWPGTGHRFGPEPLDAADDVELRGQVDAEPVKASGAGVSRNAERRQRLPVGLNDWVVDDEVQVVTEVGTRHYPQLLHGAAEVERLHRVAQVDVTAVARAGKADELAGGALEDRRAGGVGEDPGKETLEQELAA